MVKSLKYFWKAIKLSLLLTMLAVICLAIWLHEGERSLNAAKPWISAAINSKDAPYVIGIGDVTVDWRNVAFLGKIHITKVTFARRDGSIFAQLPEIYATIDPIGFLPNRRLLHKVILRQPRMFMTRNAEGMVELGIEDSPSRMPLADLVAFFTADAGETTITPPSLPFRDFAIDDASFTFTDEITQTKIVSTPFDFNLKRRSGAYDAVLAMPFMVDAQPVMLSAGMRALPKTDEHVVAVQLKQMPARLICLFGTCPPQVETDGAINGKIAVAIADKDISIRGFRVELATQKAQLKAPEWFAEPIKLGASTLAIEGDWSQRQVTLKQAKLQLEDTLITAAGKAHKAEDGWYVSGNGATTQLDITKVYKYWPLFMAPDSRTWVTSKLKSGYAASSTITVNFTPADFAAEFFPEKSIDAKADARNITFEYLPGFPLVQNMNGIAHFTATTVKVEGGGGTLLSGTKIDHAVLWCPELHSLKNPMEATVTLSAPAADAATMLALKHFPFDDPLTLDAKTIRGSVDTSMKLKFNAFSGKENSDPNEIHLEAVDYDITATLKDIAQKNIYGGYDLRSISGSLKASNAGLSLDAAVQLGESEINDITLAQESGQSLSLTVKGRPNQTGAPINDFNLVYSSASEIPSLTLRGKRMDASVSYGSKESGLLADFPAIAFDVDMGELILARAQPFTDVVGSLRCSKARCESADFKAKAGVTEVKGGITTAGGKRQFLMTANDAGSMLKAFDISDRVTKGTFEMRGAYDDTKNPPQLNARLLITDFTLINSQILGRILSVASLTGIANALTGSGISFDKLSANIDSRAGVITVDKGVASGNAIGITVEGTVDTSTTKLGLKGVVVPAYALNSFIGKIPVIGMLAGGEGEGLIAFNYWVKGTYVDPDVGVNPLSGLTPGFLRGIFGVFDSKPAKEGDAPKAKSTQPAGQNIESNVHRP